MPPPELLKGVVVWFTGLPGAGKSTLAEVLVQRVRALGRSVELLDADVVRSRLSPGIGFSREDRDANVTRLAFVARLLAQHGVFVVVAAISPFRNTRDAVRATIETFVEIYVATPLAVCIKRDPKRLYARAVAGDIPNFTGISDPYEEPLDPEMTVDTSASSINDDIERILSGLRRLGYLCSPHPALGATTKRTPP
jgi:adenylylsulfate kinase